MSNAKTGADFLVEALEAYDIQHIFGNPGTTELPLMHALSGSSLEYILALHEDIAVGMGAGYSSTRRYHHHHDSDINPAGFVNLHTAAGLAHGLGNLYAAYISGSPLVVTAGIHSTDFQHEEPVLYEDLAEMADPFTKWSAEVKHVDALPTMIRRAFRTALSEPTGPVFLGLPLNVLMDELNTDPQPLGMIPKLDSGDPDSIDEAVTLLKDAEEPAIVVGDHIARSGFNAVEAAMELAEKSGARVHGELLACEVNFPTDHDHWVSYLPPQEELMSLLLDTDTILFVGCSTQTTLTRHDDKLVPEHTKCIHIGNDAWQLGKNEPSEVSILGDPGKAMRKIADGIDSQLSDERRQERIEKIAPLKEMVDARIESMASRDDDSDRASKIELVHSMLDVAPDAYIVDEGVTSKYAMLTQWPLQTEQYLSNKGGGLGFGLPASVGAALAESQRPDPRKVLGFVGDGSYLYYPHSIYSAVRHDIDLTVVIPDNRNYRILKDNTLEILGGEEADYEFIGMDFDPPVDLAKNAQSHGANAQLVKTAEEIPPAFNKALSQDGPSVLDILVHD